MRETPMLKSIAVVLTLSVAGDTAANALQMPIPGAAVGLLLLICLFILRGGPDGASQRIFDTISPVFPMFFVPAAVGVIANADTLSLVWLFAAVAIVLGTTATILATGLVAQFLFIALMRERST